MGPEAAAWWGDGARVPHGTGNETDWWQQQQVQEVVDRRTHAHTHDIPGRDYRFVAAKQQEGGAGLGFPSVPPVQPVWLCALRALRARRGRVAVWVKQNPGKGME